MNSLIKNAIVTAVGIGILVSAFSADAGLITRKGRSVGTDSFNETTGLFDNTAVFNGIGYESGVALSGYSRNSFYELVYATPKDDCHFKEVTFPQDQDVYRTACSYEYAYGEDIQFFGSLDYQLPGAASYDLLWTITGNGHYSEYLSSYTDALSVDMNLNILSPRIKPGSYQVSVRLTIDSGDDRSFFSYSAYTDDYVCAVLGPVGTPETCGQTGNRFDVWSRTNGSTLVITAPEPGSMALALIGMLGLFRLRKRS